MELNWNFQGGEGEMQNKKASVVGGGGVQIFSGAVQCLADALLMDANITLPSRETALLGIS